MGTVTGENPAAAPGGAVRAAEVAIGGMTCASCAARIEKKLNKLDGVAATVNFATETAQVTFPAAMPPDELISAVERAGYAATLPAPRQDERPARQLRTMAPLRRTRCGSGCWCRWRWRSR